MNDIVAYYGYQSPFSTCHLARAFFVNGQKYRSVEQFAQVQKAELFDDWEAKEAIAKTWKPMDAVRLGSLVKGFQMTKWMTAAPHIYFVGNLGKFAANPTLLTELRATGEKVLVEASLSRVWGAGALMADLQNNNGQYEGENLHGRILMEVRKVFRESPAHSIRDMIGGASRIAENDPPPSVSSLPHDPAESLDYVRKLRQQH